MDDGKEVWYEIEVETEPERWAVVRRDVTTEPDARKRLLEVKKDHKTRGLDRACRAVKCTREVLR